MIYRLFVICLLIFLNKLLSMRSFSLCVCSQRRGSSLSVLSAVKSGYGVYNSTGSLGLEGRSDHNAVQ